MIKNIYFDTDCLCSFLWVNKEDILLKLYANRIIVPKQVYEELSNPCVPHLKNQIDQLVSNNKVEVKAINISQLSLYKEITDGKSYKGIGKGEASAIILALPTRGILASNNMKDIDYYIKLYKLEHLTTGKILKEALGKNIIDELEGNDIWNEMRQKRRTLPCSTFSEYLKTK